MDLVAGTFDEETLIDAIGSPAVNPFIGHTSGARLDYPGLGMIENLGESPGLSAMQLFGFSQHGYNELEKPDSNLWDTEGRLVGTELHGSMKDYVRTLTLLVVTDDEVDYENRVQ